MQYGPFVSVQVNVNGSGQNITGDAANEPSIAIDPTDPNKIAIGWRQFNTINSDFRQAGHAYSQDGGQTWTFPGVFTPGVFRSDPSLDFDAEGNFYYYSLKGNFTCDTFISTDGGVTWSQPYPAKGGDKNWIAVDRTSGIGHGNVYCVWSGNYNFTRSTDGGHTYMNPIASVAFWSNLTVGPDGKVYVCGWDGGSYYKVQCSSNAQNPGANPSWDGTWTANLGGGIVYSSGPNPGGLLGQIWIAVNPAPGSHYNEVYMLASVNPSGSDPLDVHFIRSTDGGKHWSSPVRVNDDPAGNGAWQWFGTMSVSPDGRIDVVWNDTRNTGKTNMSELFYAYSYDGGQTWSENVQVTPAWNSWIGWPQQDKIGDYYHMVSFEDYAVLAYSATFNGEQDVYYARKNVGATAVAESPFQGLALLHADSNPFVGSTKVRYTVPAGGLVTLKLYDILGREVATLASGDRSAGSFEAQLDARNLPAGVYICRLSAGQFHAAKKMLLLK